MDNETKQRPSFYVVGLVAMFLGLVLLLIAGSWANPGVGELGAGLWAVGSSGMGVVAGLQRRGSAWGVALCQLAIFGLPAMAFAWLISAGTGFLPLFALNTCLPLAAPILGFWLGFYAGIKTSGPAGNDPGHAVQNNRKFVAARRVWLAIALLQFCVIGEPILSGLWPAFSNVVEGFWLELSLMLWLPVGMAICSVLPWSCIVGRPRPKSSLLLWLPCCIGWVFLLGFALLLTIESRHWN